MQSEFVTELLSNDPDNEINRAITAAVKRFLTFTFGWQPRTTLPTLEDIFTMIDLSAATGHALGSQNFPKRLRALRRMLIHRVFTILDRRFSMSSDITRLLDRIYDEDDKVIFVVLNWDVVLERHLDQLRVSRPFAYAVNERPWSGPTRRRSHSTYILKVHGSANWVYCDNCRQVFYDPYSKLALHIKAGLSDDDFKLFDDAWPDGKIERMGGREQACIDCNLPVGPHIATFSYRKSFRSAALTRSWATAEEKLTAANRWLFIGYSLPQADYEFVHLLKTAELKLARQHLRPIKIDVVVRNDDQAESRFRQVFGSAINVIEQNGLSGYLRGGLDNFLA